MRDILVLCPQERDLRCIEAAGLEARYRVRYAGSDLDHLEGFDPEAFLDECMDIPADGVVGTKDLSALLAALLAERRGLPGPTPAALVACQHKPTSRALQASAAPEAVPRFALLSTGGLPLPYFVKPVVGRLSQNAVRIDDPSDLQALHELDRYTNRYGDIASLAGLPADAVHGFLAEELMGGDEVTYEGYVHDGTVVTIGITDSVKYPGSNSFERFEYPTRFSPARHDEIESIMRRVLPALGFDGGFFNAELFVPEEGPVKIIEVNGRISSQFTPLVQSTHGRSTYEALFELACGDDPGWGDAAPRGVGVSYCRRVFSDAFVRSVPDPEADLEVLVRPGLYLSEQGTNDAQSFRLLILYGWGPTREEAVEVCRLRADELQEESFVLEPVSVR